MHNDEKMKNKKHLPLYGIGPVLCWSMAIITAIGIYCSAKKIIPGIIENKAINRLRDDRRIKTFAIYMSDEDKALEFLKKARELYREKKNVNAINYFYEEEEPIKEMVKKELLDDNDFAILPKYV